MKKRCQTAAGEMPAGGPEELTPDSAGTAGGDLAAALDRITAALVEIRATLGGRPRPFYTVGDVVRYTGSSSDTVRRWISEGRLAATRVAGTGPKGKLLVGHQELMRLLGAGGGDRDVSPGGGGRDYSDAPADGR